MSDTTPGAGGLTALTTPLPKPGGPDVTERTDRIAETFEPTIPVEPHADAIELMGDPSPSIALGRRSAFSIGRSRSCDLRLDSGFVSGHHLELRLVQGAWTVVDLGSLNGVFVDGVLVVRAEALRVGQVVRCGRRGPAFRLITREAQ